MSSEITLRSHIDVDAASARNLLQYHVAEREIGGFHSTETSHPPRFQIPGHFHDLASLYLVLQGSLTESYEHKRRECKSPNVVFTPAGEKHSNLFNARGGRCFLIEIPEAFIERLAAAGVRIEHSLHSEGGVLAWLAMRLYREFSRPDAVSLLAIEGLMLEALCELGRWNEPLSVVEPLWLRETRDLLHDRFQEAVTLDELGRMAGVDPAHLARSFRRHYRCTVGEYQRRLRIDFASRQLSETRTSILNIALAAGFADQAHFSRTFRKHTGLTPAKFRSAFGCKGLARE
ncbi:MAG TPA: helix-turn-helix transcriptional regulator [Blastocatellia bacterium]|nr:helix-turn-helix transcriptional regulator [Blastocatellia bacterium]